MDSSPRPGYYPDPSVPGYIRYWDGAEWVAGTSKPMPEGGVGVIEGEAPPPAPLPRKPGPAPIAFPRMDGGAEASAHEAPFAAPRPPMDDAIAAPPEPDLGLGGGPLFREPWDSGPHDPGFSPADSAREWDFGAVDSGIPAPRSAPQGSGFPEEREPAFPVPPRMSDVSFDDPQKSAFSGEPEPGFQPGFPPGGQPGMAGPSGFGMPFAGQPAPAAPKPTPAQLAATNQPLRIRLKTPDGKPFDGPDITTGTKEPELPTQPDFTASGMPRGPKKQAPKVVVKSGPMEKLGHIVAVLAISALGIVPLAYLLLQNIHDREDKLAATISVPTKMNVLDTTAETYLGAMAVILLVVALAYRARLRRRR